MTPRETKASAAPHERPAGHVQPGLPSLSLRRVLCFLIQAYRLLVSPAQVYLFGAQGGCRFTPTCSQYAMEAIREHGALAGSVLAARRICRCHPLGECGHDPVPKVASLPQTEKHLRPC
jgi:putative membrane protein insertion efficiency factor